MVTKIDNLVFLIIIDIGAITSILSIDHLLAVTLGKIFDSVNLLTANGLDSRIIVKIDTVFYFKHTAFQLQCMVVIKVVGPGFLITDFSNKFQAIYDFLNKQIH